MTVDALTIDALKYSSCMSICNKSKRYGVAYDRDSSTRSFSGSVGSALKALRYGK